MWVQFQAVYLMTLYAQHWVKQILLWTRWEDFRIQVMRTSEFLRILWKPTLWLWWETPHWQTTQRSISRTVFYVDFKSLWCSYFLYLLEMCWTLFKKLRKHLVIMKWQDVQNPSQCWQRKQTMEGVHHSDPGGNKRRCKWGWNVRKT